MNGYEKTVCGLFGHSFEQDWYEPTYMQCSTCGYSFDDEYEGLDHDPRECGHAKHDGRPNLHSIAGIEYDIWGNNVMARKECA